MLPGIWAAAVIAITAAVIGATMGDLFAHRRSPFHRGVLIIAGLATIGLLAVPFPRRGAPVQAKIFTNPVGPRVLTIASGGALSYAQRMNVTVQLSPKDAAHNADWLVVNSWQSGRLETATLREIQTGVYVTSRPVATGGTAKAIVFLQSRDVLVAAPVSLPADPEYGLAPVPAQPEHTQSMVPASTLLMRETHDGAQWPAEVAYAGLGLTVVAWMTALIACFVALNRRSSTQSSIETTQGVHAIA